MRQKEQGYRRPDTGYSPPKKSHSPPQKSYIPPKNSYSPPQNSYSPPQNGYSPPTKSYSPPTKSYSPPKEEYGPPQKSYVPPEKSYEQPEENYQLPDESYTSPEEDYTRPKEAYTRPDETYIRPEEIYTRPDETYTRPDETYIRPTTLSTGYKEPVSDYALPEYQAEESITREQTLPSRNYGVPQANVLSFFDSNSDDLSNYKSGSSSVVGSDDYLKMLMNVLPGIPGQDYPLLSSIPQTSFSCEGRVYAGYYADPATDCQVFHVCSQPRGFHSFLCPNGTIFNQAYLTCDFWYNSDCSKAESLYGINEEIQKERESFDTSQAMYQDNEQPTYTGSTASGGMYGRQGRNLEISITTPRTTTGEKRISPRHAAKYSWASLP